MKIQKTYTSYIITVFTWTSLCLLIGIYIRGLTAETFFSTGLYAVSFLSAAIYGLKSFSKIASGITINVIRFTPTMLFMASLFIVWFTYASEESMAWQISFSATYLLLGTGVIILTTIFLIVIGFQYYMYK